MSEYSPQADALLGIWNCMSLNMRSVILRARYLQNKAIRLDAQSELDCRLRDLRINDLYGDIGRMLREIVSEDGVEKSFPETDSAEGGTPPRRFVDFRIDEEAIPSVSRKLEEVNDRVLQLLITLCGIRF